MTIHIVNVSGGKDSTALWILAHERGIAHQVVNADTGNEHPATLEYLDYLETKLGPITRVKADFSARIAHKRKHLPTRWAKEGIDESVIERAVALLEPTGVPFLDLCLLKTRFPSTLARFCTQELKYLPIRAQVIDPLLDAGHEVWSWQGHRATESTRRATYAELEEIDEGLHVHRPLLSWSADEVFAAHHRAGIEPNPLYKLGCKRVSCAPCFHMSKPELRNLAQRWPEHVERLVEWERLVASVSKRGRATFFPSKTTPKGSRDPNAVQPDARAVFDWSFTQRNGQRDPLGELEPPACSSLYGLCE